MSYYDNRLTGVIDNTEITFCSSENEFLFMPLSLERKAIDIPSPKGFIYGTTHGGNRVAINVNRDTFGLLGSARIKTPLYIYSELPAKELDISRFSKLIFSGGILNKLLSHKVLQNPFDERQKAIADREHYEEHYEFETDDFRCRLTIGTASFDAFDDNYLLFKNNTFLMMEFDKEQPIESIYTHYYNVNLLLSFMTHRTQNRVEQIIMIPCVEQKTECRKHCFVHFQENDSAELSKNVCFTFDFLGESTAKLLSLFYNSKSGKPSYSLGFIPRTDSEARVITDDTVRAVTAALECEYSANESLQKECEKEIERLQKYIKDLIKEYREKTDETSSLSDETYNAIFSDIGHWGITAKEKYCALMNKYKDRVEEFYAIAPKFDEADISALVKYRNRISHGNYCEMDDQVIRSARFMKLMIYCSLLNRLGIPYDKLKDMMFTNIIY